MFLPIVTLLIYIMSRESIKILFPVNSYENWILEQDSYISIVRFTLIIVLIYFSPLTKPFFKKVHISKKMLCFAFINVIGVIIFQYSYGISFLEIKPFTTLIISNILVAIFEEYLFRGVLHEKLSAICPSKAVSYIINSSLFTFLHIGHIEFLYLGPVFLFGYIMLTLRDSGETIFSLIAVHFVYNTMIYNFPSSHHVDLGLWALYNVVVYVIYYLFIKKKLSH